MTGQTKNHGQAVIWNIMNSWFSHKIVPGQRRWRIAACPGAPAHSRPRCRGTFYNIQYLEILTYSYWIWLFYTCGFLQLFLFLMTHYVFFSFPQHLPSRDLRKKNKMFIVYIFLYIIYYETWILGLAKYIRARQT